MKTLIKAIASRICAIENCRKRPPLNPDAKADHEATLRRLEKLLPSGSGFDDGTTIDLDRSTSDKIVLLTAFHHMDEMGDYDWWTEHTITVEPSFVFGLAIKVSGKNRNDINNYIAETFQCDLSQEIPDDKT